MDPSSVDKDNSIYRLVGVVEHRGTGSAKTGHYIAYVRARRLGNDQHQSSCSHSWFRANDDIISKVSLEQVLECEAYILFYERMEG
uniref:USP domain-containing protein n=1 Tax=Arundo donax TaxID=35708 RepID=A0A0A8XXB1_ARUDO